MIQKLSIIQKNIINQLQKDIPLCNRPFKILAEKMGISEDQFMSITKKLHNNDLLVRFRPQINYRPLGKISSLICAHVPSSKLLQVGNTITSNDKVSHNYVRNHFYNLWFTFQDESINAIDQKIRDLSQELDIEMYSMPAVKLFKLQVYFDLVEPEIFHENELPELPVEKRIILDDDLQKVLLSIQCDLKICKEPFKDIVEFDMLKRLKDIGVIRKIAFMVNYRKLGFKASIMFVAKVKPEKVEEVGRKLSYLKLVTHCYERRSFSGWDYNLFAMMHSFDKQLIEAQVEKLKSEGLIEKYIFLETVKELKKKPIYHQ